jgi:hypothetical protein
MLNAESALTARDIRLQIELVRFAQFVARVHLLLENSQIIPNHDDLVEDCLEPAAAGKLISTEANCPQAAQPACRAEARLQPPE